MPKHGGTPFGEKCATFFLLFLLQFFAVFSFEYIWPISSDEALQDGDHLEGMTDIHFEGEMLTAK
jgi:hypothetical protein